MIIWSDVTHSTTAQRVAYRFSAASDTERLEWMLALRKLLKCCLPCTTLYKTVELTNGHLNPENYFQSRHLNLFVAEGRDMYTPENWKHGHIYLVSALDNAKFAKTISLPGPNPFWGDYYAVE